MKKIIFLFVITLLAYSCNNDKKTADAYGNFESDEIIISSEVNGKIIQFNVEEGDLLQKGDLIAVVDTIPLLLKLESLRAQRMAIVSRSGNVVTQVDVLKQQKANLEKELQRIVELLKDGAATPKQRDDILYQINILERQIDNVRSQNSPILAEAVSMDAQIDMLLDQIQRAQIFSPIDASVLSKYVNENEVTAAGKPILKIANLKTMYLKAYISGSQLASVKLNQEVLVRIDDEENSYREFKGKITWISSQAEFTPKVIQTKKERVNLVYAIKVRVINDGSIKIGMPGELVF